MDDLKNQYNELVLERQEILEQMKVLKEDKKVKKYFELDSKDTELVKKINSLYQELKIQEYSCCHHIWVNTLHDYDSWEGRSYDYHGCVKCGLDERVLYLMEGYDSPNWLTFDQRIKYDFIRSNYPYNIGIDTGLSYDLDLGKAIYTKIKQTYPNIDDETAVKYFEIALEVALKDKRNNKVSDETKESSTKKLSL